MNKTSYYLETDKSDTELKSERNTELKFGKSANLSDKLPIHMLYIHI